MFAAKVTQIFLMMKKSILQVGSPLSKAQQKSVLGGEWFGGGCPGSPSQLSPGGYAGIPCESIEDCPTNPIAGAPFMCDFNGCCLYAY